MRKIGGKGLSQAIIDGNELAKTRYEAGLAVRGSTFEIKDQLKRYGCLWHSEQKVWVAPDADTLRQIEDAFPHNVIRAGTVAQRAPTPLAHHSDYELLMELQARGFSFSAEMVNARVLQLIDNEHKKQAEEQRQIELALDDNDVFDVKV